jgi:hypothetical protein
MQLVLPASTATELWDLSGVPLSAVCDVPLTGGDVAVLIVVRMGDEATKRLSEISQLLNRVDGCASIMPGQIPRLTWSRTESAIECRTSGAAGPTRL